MSFLNDLPICMPPTFSQSEATRARSACFARGGDLEQPCIVSHFQAADGPVVQGSGVASHRRPNPSLLDYTCSLAKPINMSRINLWR